MKASLRVLSYSVLAVAISFSFCLAGPAKQPAKYRDDTILVKPKKGVALAQLEHVHKQLGVRVQHTLKGIGNLQIVKLPPGLSVEKAIAHYEKSGKVAYAEPDYEVHAVSVDTNENCQALSTTSDPYFQDGTLWGMHNYGQNGGTCGADIDAPEAWETRTDAGNTVVAVIDTGIRYTHEDLAANMWTNPGEIPGNGIDDDNNGVVDDVYGARFINGVASGDPWDDHFHGSHVSGTIMGSGDNGKGVIGVAWSGKIMAVKFLSASGSGYISDAVLAIDYARQMGAKVLNNSWGGGGFSQALLDAIHATRDANMIFVAAAGNNSSDNDSSIFYPANYDSDNIVTVAATDRNDQLAGFSNWGKNSVELGAPGVDVWSCNNTSDSAYRYASGTSMATPHTAGVCALLWAQYPTASYSSIITRLLRGVDYLDSLGGKTITGGRLNLHRSIEDPVADFDVAVTNNPAPMTVTFTDRSLAWTSPIVSQQFDFGDGTITNGAVVSHTYSTAGPYFAVLRVDNADGNYSTKVRQIPPHIANGVMQVDPVDAYWAEGPYGGPFTPSSKEYRVYNWGDGTLEYTVTPSVNWAYVDLPSDSLPPGWSTAVNVFIGNAALTLQPGIYGGSVDFVNTGNGAGNAQRWLQLTVKAPGALVVTPTNAFEAAGYTGGPFTPSNFTYAVQNVSTNFTLDFAAVPNADWQTVEPEAGTLGPGQSTNVVVTINANATNLAIGVYSETVGFNNETTGEYLGDRETKLTVNSLLVVTPAGNFNSSGPVGGPFAPNSITYTLQWLGTTPVNWTAYGVDDWFTVSPEFGTLNSNETVEVTVSYNSSADSLPEGVWESGVSFTADQFDTYVNRFTQLIVGQGQLFVSPYGGFSVTGPQSGPFSPAAKTYRLTWVGVTNLQWSTDFSANWITASPASGTLTNGQYVDVTISVNPQSLTPGNYEAFFEFINAETERTYEVFAVNLTVTPAGTLTVEPSGSATITGPEGGPFPAFWYTLRNNTSYPLNWTASGDQPWMSLQNTNNTLPAGGIAYMTVGCNAQANSFATGSYTGLVTFVNTSNGSGNTTRPAILTVTPTSYLSLTPATDLVSTGSQGGPFTPIAQVYSLSNTGGQYMGWSIGRQQTWAAPSVYSGILAPGASTNITLTILGSTTNFAVGSYTNQMFFQNDSSLRGNTTRNVILTVTANAVLSVTPSGGASSSGYVGGPFTPANFAYQLSNTGTQPMNWTASKTAAWVSLSQTSGSLNPGQSTTVDVSINSSANSLAAGTYNDTVSFNNATSGVGNTTRAVTLTVNPIPPGVLSVSPAGGLTSSGYQYGPFSPSSQAYTLSNTGSLALNWTASKSATWVSLSSTSGSLNPGANTTVTVSINSGANSLAGGSYSDTVSFTNTTSGNGNTTRPVSLSVTAVILNAPTSLVATQLTSTSVRLNWTDTSTNEEGFAIERAVKSGNNWGAYSQIATVGADTTTYTNTGVSKKSYRYRVRSYRGTNYGPYSNVAEITVR